MTSKTRPRHQTSRPDGQPNGRADNVADVVEFRSDPCDPEIKATRRGVRTLLIALAMGIVVVAILFNFVTWATRP